nr:hypothetical protein [Tanacetum cinerariifolium]
MQDYKPISTPFPTDVKLSSRMSPSSEKERMKMSRVPYASAVRSLMFAMICTRPDIAHAVGVVSDLDGSKSTTGYVFTLSGGTELGHGQEKINLFCDNQSALYLARNPTFHSKTKHIRVQHHFVREKVEEGTVDMRKIHTNDNVEDYLTKAINCDKFIWCRSSCGLTET